MKKLLATINQLLSTFSEVRYVAIYQKDQLISKQKGSVSNSSAGESDQYEEILVNPTLLKLASQRGNIDCGGLNYLLIGYGNFFQLVKEIPNGHISICLEKEADLNAIPEQIFTKIDYLLEESL